MKGHCPGSTGQRDEHAAEPGNRGSCEIREGRPRGWTPGRSRPRRAGNRCANSSSQLDVSAGYTAAMPAPSGVDATDQWPRTPSRGNFDHEHFGARGSKRNLTPGSTLSHVGAADVGYWSWQVKRSNSRGVSRFVPPGAARLHLPSCTAFARSTAPRGELGRGSPKLYGENRCRPPGRESVRGAFPLGVGAPCRSPARTRSPDVGQRPWARYRCK